MNRREYRTPLSYRYASKEMSYLFSEEFRYTTWRRLWVVLAEEQKRLGLHISDEQIKELQSFEQKINYEDALQFEESIQHEVMSHIQAYGKQCPKARGIIHLGATSAYVLDNTDLIQMQQGMVILQKRIIELMRVLKDFALKYQDTMTLSFTHFQPAQPCTVGKRASLWLQELLYDYEDLTHRLEKLPFRGVKGTTGTQNSFLKLFTGDAEKVKKLDEAITKRMGFQKAIAVAGQTYSRKIDYWVVSVLSGIAQSAHKFSNDIRLLQNLRELEEPFGDKQIGSSAMPYKRNPMKSERVASLSRYVINILQNTAITASQQWLERSLDDSANKRLSIPEAFLATDAILQLYHHIIEGLTVNTRVIKQNLKRHLPFMLSEDILMQAVQKGADRQDIHEVIRRASFQALEELEHSESAENPLLKLLAEHPTLPLTIDELEVLLTQANLVGLSSMQVSDFIHKEVQPLCTQYMHKDNYPKAP